MYLLRCAGMHFGLQCEPSGAPPFPKGLDPIRQADCLAGRARQEPPSTARKAASQAVATPGIWRFRGPTKVAQPGPLREGLLAAGTRPPRPPTLPPAWREAGKGPPRVKTAHKKM